MISGETLRLFEYYIFSGSKDRFSDNFRGVVNTINPHSFIIARKDLIFREALLASDYLLPDGVGIVLACKILAGKRIKRISGSDLHEKVLNLLEKSAGSCFYLGSSEETLQRIKERLDSERPSVKAGFFSPPFKKEFSEEDSSAMIMKVDEFKPDVLFIGMTAPKQEKWVFINRDRLNVPAICCIGAVFDFYSGTVKRPGKFWINLGLEWLPRLLREPKRLWRRNFVSNPLFMILVYIEKLKIILSDK